MRLVLSLVLFGLLTAAVHADPYHHAVLMGDIKTVQALLNSDAHLANARDEDGFTPLNIAVVNEHDAIVKLLLSKGADVNAAARVNGQTPLEEAVIGDNLGVTKILLAHGARVNVRDHKGRTAVWWAARDTMPPAPHILVLLRQHSGATRSH